MTSIGVFRRVVSRFDNRRDLRQCPPWMSMGQIASLRSFATQLTTGYADRAAYLAIFALGALLFWLSADHPALMPVWAPWDFSIPIYLATALTLLWYFRGLALSAPERNAVRGTPGRLPRGTRADLCRAADPFRILVAAHVLPQPHPARGDAPSRPASDRARLAGPERSGAACRAGCRRCPSIAPSRVTLRVLQQPVAGGVAVRRARSTSG